MRILNPQSPPDSSWFNPLLAKLDDIIAHIRDDLPGEDASLDYLYDQGKPGSSLKGKHWQKIGKEVLAGNLYAIFTVPQQKLLDYSKGARELEAKLRVDVAKLCTTLKSPNVLAAEQLAALQQRLEKLPLLSITNDEVKLFRDYVQAELQGVVSKFKPAPNWTPAPSMQPS